MRAVGAPGLLTAPPPTQSKKIRHPELKRAPSSRHRRARGRLPLFPQPGWAAAGGAGPAQQPARKGVPADPPGLGEWPSRTEPPLGLGGAPEPGRGGARARVQGPLAAQARGGCRGPRGPGPGFVCGSAALGRRQPGYKMAGKGWDRRRSPRGAPRSACTAAGEGRARPRRRAPPAPRRPPAAHPLAGDPAPLRPRRLCLAAAAAASRRRAPAAAAAENGCQSGASRHAAAGGGARGAPRPAPCPRAGTLRRAPGPSRAPGSRGRSGGERGGGGAVTCGRSGVRSGRPGGTVQ